MHMHMCQVRICLPPSSARVCEPFGELWKQVGGWVGGMCATFDIGAIATWRARLRSAPALIRSVEEARGYFPLKPASVREYV